MKKFLIITVFVSGLGTVFFFPLDIDGKYTCFYHGIIDHAHGVTKSVHPEMTPIHDTGTPRSKPMTTKQDGDHHKNPTHGVAPHMSHGSILLDKYIDRYAIVWWISAVLFVFTVLKWQRFRKIKLIKEKKEIFIKG